MFGRKKNVESLTVKKAAGILSSSLSGYLAESKPLADKILSGNDSEAQTQLTNCFHAFQAGFYVEAGGRLASGGREARLTDDEARFGMLVAEELLGSEQDDGKRMLQIAFQFSNDGHETAYQLGRREGQRFVRQQGSSLPRSDMATLQFLFSCILDGTYEELVLK